MIFTEVSRVKISCILHLVRLGFDYLALKNAKWDEDTNIFPGLFRSSIAWSGTEQPESCLSRATLMGLEEPATIAGCRASR